MSSFGNSMFLAPELPPIANQEDSNHISWTSSITHRRLSNGGGSHDSSMKRPHQDVLAGEVADDDGELPKKRKGRPPGSKNKPKHQPILISKDYEPFLKTNILEISAGQDVIQALINFACRINSGITVLSGIGLISHASLRLPVPQAQPLILNGPHSLLALNGTVLVGPATRMDNNGTSRIMLPSRTSMSVSVAGTQGSVCGGVVAGKLIAGSTVTIVATAFSNPCIHNLSSDGKTGVIDPNRASTSANGGGFGIPPSSLSMLAATNFNVATPILPLNNQIADDINVMQWGQRNAY